MENKACPVIAIQLDKERHLQFDFNAYIAFEEETGINVLELEGKFSFTVIRALLWVGLQREDEELTLKQVGAMLNAGNMLYAQQKINETLALSMGDNEGKASKNG